MARRPKTLFLLSLLGLATPFQASSGRPVKFVSQTTASQTTRIDDASSSSSDAASSPKSAIQGPQHFSTTSRSPFGPSNPIINRRRGDSVVLQSTAAYGLAGPPPSFAAYGLASPPPPSSRDGPLYDLRAGDAVQHKAHQLGKVTAKTALGLILLELVARITGLSSPRSTLLAPRLLSPVLDASTAFLTFVLGPFFTVQLWSTLAPFASIALKLSPMPTIQRIRRTRTTGGLPLLPYSAMCTMTFVLVAYGLLIHDAKVVVTHGIGHLLTLYYCYTFGRHVDRNATNLPGTIGLHVKTGVSIASAIALAIFTLGEKAASAVGLTSVLLSCLMYTGPLTALKHAIRTKSARNIPLPYAVASSLNAFAWLIYGAWGIRDVMIWAPCLIGFASATAQIAVNVVYGNDSEEEEMKYE